uniref:Transposase n=1 Tax=Dictyoglomus turgidum TaxID=513050 RepID=A0A7C3SN91_9BACT
MLLTRKIRIKIRKQDAQKLEEQSNLCRQLYNYALRQRISAYKEDKKSLTVWEQKKELPKLKKEHPEYARVYNKYLSSTLFRLDRAFKAFFQRCNDDKRKGFPRFRGKYYWFTLTCPSMYCRRISNRILQLPQKIIVKTTEDIPENFGDINIVKSGEKWFITFTYEVKEKEKPLNDDIIACDLGLRNLVSAVSTQGRIIERQHLKPSKKELRRLDNLRSKRDKCKKSSNRWVYLTNRLRDENREWQNRVNDRLHKVSTYLTKMTERNLVIGRLRPSSMNSSNRWLNRFVHGEWRISRFREMLIYKCRREGKDFFEINEVNTTKTCCVCGTLRSMRLSDRTYRCRTCGNVMPRDINSAFNLLKRFLPGLGHISSNGYGVLARARNLNTFNYV